MLKINERTFGRLSLFAIVAGFTLLVIAFVVTAWTTSSNQKANAEVDHTYQVTDALSRVGLAMERTETATRGYLLAPSPTRAENRHRYEAQIRPALTKVRDLTKDNPSQRATLEQLETKVLDQLETIDAIMNLAESGKLAEGRAVFVERVKIRQIDQIRVLLLKMRNVELQLLEDRKGQELAIRGQLQVILAIVGLLMLALGIATFSIVRSYTRQMVTARDELRRLNTDLEGVVQERTSDLVRANEEIQRFAYIVSHDLRSPLVNVLGFTAELESANKAIGGMVDRVEKEKPELVSDEARFATREDLPEAIQFIRSSTQKMDRLINAILTLSRQGRRVLTPELLPMNAVIGEVIASLATLAENQGSDVTIEGTLPEVVHDRLAIEQIFQNLIENAIKYQEKDKAGHVVVSGAVNGGRAIFEVRDNGRGIAPEDHRRIFELFRRSGAQDQRGEGIGLAHVQSLIFRLGGTIDVKSTLGEGSTFIVNLPIEYREKGDH